MCIVFCLNKHHELNYLALMFCESYVELHKSCMYSTVFPGVEKWMHIYDDLILIQYDEYYFS